MQREMLDRDPGGAERAVELGSEVQPGGGRRRRAPQTREDGLVALGIGQRGPDVGRQGRLAVTGEQRAERLAAAGRPRVPASARRRASPPPRPQTSRAPPRCAASRRGAGGRGPAPPRSRRARRTRARRRRRRPAGSGAPRGTAARRAPRWPCETGPGRGSRGCRCARARRRGAAGPADRESARSSSASDAPAPRGHEQARGVAPLERRLGDQLGRQGVVELVEPHLARRAGGCHVTAPARAAGATFVPGLPFAGHAAAVALPVQAETPALVDAARVVAPQVGVDELDAGRPRRPPGRPARSDRAAATGSPTARSKRATGRGSRPRGRPRPGARRGTPGNAAGGRAAGGGQGGGPARPRRPLARPGRVSTTSSRSAAAA